MTNPLTTKGNRLMKIKAEITKLNAKVKELKAQQTELEQTILDRMDDDGMEQFATATTTFFPSESEQVRVADKAAFLDYVFANQAYHLLTSHVAQQPSREERDLEGAIPGIEFIPKRVLNTRARSSK